VFAPIDDLLFGSDALRVLVMVAVGVFSFGLCAKILGQKELGELLSRRAKTKT